jgi:hypothetical protein
MGEPLASTFENWLKATGSSEMLSLKSLRRGYFEERSAHQLGVTVDDFKSGSCSYGFHWVTKEKARRRTGVDYNIFYVYTVETLKVALFWYVTPYRLRDEIVTSITWVDMLIMEAARSFKMAVHV